MRNGALGAGRLALALRFIGVWGPGLLVMLADTDAGNVVTAAQAGAQWGYRLLPLLVILIPPLYLVQELTVRLGIFTGRGYAELIREQFGALWGWVSVVGLAIATLSSLVTEFTAVAGVGEMYGLSRAVTLPVACAFLVLVVTTGSYRRTERAAIAVGLFELAFFAVAWNARPDETTMLRHLTDLPLGNREFLYLVAAVVGAVFNPWMVFYQQSSVVDKGLSFEDYKAARWDTAIGALLTQALTAAVLVAAAATLGAGATPAPLGSIGEISLALQPTLGPSLARLVFSVGVMGAALVAAIVASLAFAWGVGEVCGLRRSLSDNPVEARWFYAVYVACVVGSAALVWREPDLVWLNITAQVTNVFLLPIVLVFLLLLSGRILPRDRCLRGWSRGVVIAVCCAVCVLGLIGGLSRT